MLGACESVTSKQTWRTPSSTDADYFTLLAGWGYNLSDVEQIVTGRPNSAEPVQPYDAEAVTSAGE